MWPGQRVPLDNADGAGMQAHLHAFFVDADLLYDDEYAQLGMSPVFAFVTRGGDGVVSNHWPAGATWIQMPGYGLGRIATASLEAAGVVGPSAQWVLPVLGVRAIAALLLVLAVRAIWRWVAEAADRGAATLTAAAFAVGTPMLYYAVESPLRPHAYGAAITLALVWLWWHRELGAPRVRSVALGALAGLATAVRPQLAPLLLLAWHDATPQVWRVRWRALDLDREKLVRLALATGAFALWPATHARLQVWMYAGALESYAQGGVTTWLGPLLTSPFHGVLPWTPVFALGALGLLTGAIRRERGAWLLLALVVMQLWLDAGYRDAEAFAPLGSRTWAGGTSFGARKLLDAAPLLLPGAIWLAREPGVQRAGPGRWALGLAVVLMCVPTALLFGAAYVEPRVTQEVLDWTGFRAALELPFDVSRWSAARETRSLPGGVAPWLAVHVVLVPVALAAAAVGLRRWLGPARGVAVVAGLTVAAGVVAHLWIGVLVARTELALEVDPGRMERAARALNPAHARAVQQQSAAHRALVRARLGEVVP